MGRASSDDWLEIRHEILACEWARDHGWLTPKLQSVGNTGWPDRFFLRKGVHIFIEFKKPKGGKRSAKQIWWREQIIGHGGLSYFCKTAVEAIEILKQYD